MRRLGRAREVVLFVHIPKTAGSTLRHIASSQYRPRRVFSTGVEEPLAESIARLQGMPEARRRRLRLVQGHFGYGLHQLFPQRARYVTFLRDPVERAISFYSYVREEDAGGRFAALGRDWPTLREFVTDRLAPELDNGQVRQLTRLRLGEGEVSEDALPLAKRNLKRFAVIGTTERFDDSLRLCRLELGWRAARAEPRRVTRDRPPRSALDRATLTAIEETSALDLELYRLADELLSERLRDAGG